MRAPTDTIFIRRSCPHADILEISGLTLGYVYTGVVSERFQKRFHLFYHFEALCTQTKGKYFQCIELAPTSAVNC